MFRNELVYWVCKILAPTHHFCFKDPWRIHTSKVEASEWLESSNESMNPSTNRTTKATMGLEERNNDNFVGKDLLYERMVFEIKILLKPN